MNDKFIHKQFRFIGDTDRGMGYMHGVVYDLVVVERGMFGRVMDRALPPFVPMDWRVHIQSPRFVPYSSMETFRQNWQEVDELDRFSIATDKSLS